MAKSRIVQHRPSKESINREMAEYKRENRKLKKQIGRLQKQIARFLEDRNRTELSEEDFEVEPDKPKPHDGEKCEVCQNAINSLKIGNKTLKVCKNCGWRKIA